MKRKAATDETKPHMDTTTGNVVLVRQSKAPPPKRSVAGSESRPSTPTLLVQLPKSRSPISSPPPELDDELEEKGSSKEQTEDSSPLALSRRASWEEFTDVDPSYALLGELSDKKVYNDAGELNEERLIGYLQRLTQPEVIKKPKDWIEVWARMLVPVEAQADVARHLLDIGLQSDVAGDFGDILAELVRGHRVKVKAAEEAITALFECGSDQQGFLARFLFLIFPKSPTTEWGWSRVGWSWKEWWATTERILQCLESSSAFEVLCEVLRTLEQESETYLPHQQIWNESRLAAVRTTLCQLGQLTEEELPAALDVTLA